MGLFATGVTVVTTVANGVKHGMTVSAFCSVSLDPPLVLVCLNHESATYRAVREGGMYAVNVLAADQQSLSEHFARRPVEGEDQFRGVAHRAGVTGAPLLDRSLGYVECRVAETHVTGDHTIFVGRVVALEAGEAERPLLYHRSRYSQGLRPA